MSSIKTLGVLTSGGDCAGLNAVIRAVTRHARMGHGWRVLGIEDGSLGLMDSPPRYLELGDEWMGSRMLREGGTLLGTVNKGDPYRFPMPDGSVRDRSADFAAGVRALGLDALVVIGGDGSMRILWKLCSDAGIGMVGVPKTIDNDVPMTDHAVGFATALEVVTEALDRLQTTAASHQRVMVLEVMGRDAGHIAINGGIAGGADVILVPELPYTLDGIAERVKDAIRHKTRQHALVVVAEGVLTADGQAAEKTQADGEVRYGGIGAYLTAKIQQTTGIETRVTTLGHLQRGGSPVTIDRVLASTYGVHAVNLVAEGRFGRMVAWRNGSVTSVRMSEVTGGPSCLKPEDRLIHTARALGIYVGEDAPPA